MQIREAMDVATGLMRQDRWDESLKILNDGYDHMPANPWMCFLIGTCNRKLGHNSLAYLLFTEAIRLSNFEKDPEIYIASRLAIAEVLNEQGKFKLAKSILAEARKVAPGDTRVLHNIAKVNLDDNKPHVAERYTKLEIEKEGESPDALTTLSLAQLSQEKFGEGWDAWDRMVRMGGKARKVRNFWGLGQTPWWDGTPNQNVVVYGEQGHGDEIMFASCMNEVIAISKQVYIDTSKPDMVPLYERSFPDAVVLCTPDSDVHDWHTERQIDAAIPFGSLPVLFRRSVEEFPAHNGFLKSSPSKRLDMRKRLNDIGDRPKIGLAWKGGLPQTQGALRTIPLSVFAPILSLPAEFLSVQYTEGADIEASGQQDSTGVPVHHWNSVVKDFDMLTALIDELDLLITVPQTALHQRGGLGKECWILVPSRPSWPFGQTRDSCLWYPNQTRLFRQGKDEGWELTITRVAKELAGWLGCENATLAAPLIPVTEQIKFEPGNYVNH